MHLKLSIFSPRKIYECTECDDANVDDGSAQASMRDSSLQDYA